MKRFSKKILCVFIGLTLAITQFAFLAPCVTYAAVLRPANFNDLCNSIQGLSSGASQTYCLKTGITYAFTQQIDVPKGVTVNIYTGYKDDEGKFHEYTSEDKYDEFIRGAEFRGHFFNVPNTSTLTIHRVKLSGMATLYNDTDNDFYNGDKRIGRAKGEVTNVDTSNSVWGRYGSAMLRVDKGGTLNVSNCTLSRNYNPHTKDSAFQGGNHSSGVPSFYFNKHGHDTYFYTQYKNDAPSKGSAIASYGTLNVSNCTFSYCTSDEGSAIHANTNGSNTVTISNCQFHHNIARDAGGAIGIFGMTKNQVQNDYCATIKDCTFSKNVGCNNGGGAIFTGYSAKVKITGSTMSNNKAFTLGGGLKCNGGEGDDQENTGNPGGYTYVEDCIFNNNYAAEKGGGVYVKGVSSKGLTTELYIKDSKLYNNTASDGGGLDAPAFAKVTMEDCQVYNNTANGKYTSNNAVPENSTSGSRGGGVSFRPGNNETNNAKVIKGSKTLIYNNHLVKNGTYNVFGGGIYNGSTNLAITNCRVGFQEYTSVTDFKESPNDAKQIYNTTAGNITFNHILRIYSTNDSAIRNYGTIKFNYDANNQYNDYIVWYKCNSNDVDSSSTNLFAIYSGEPSKHTGTATVVNGATLDIRNFPNNSNAEYRSGITNYGTFTVNGTLKIQKCQKNALNNSYKFSVGESGSLNISNNGGIGIKNNSGATFTVQNSSLSSSGHSVIQNNNTGIENAGTFTVKNGSSYDYNATRPYSFKVLNNVGNGITNSGTITLTSPYIDSNGGRGIENDAGTLKITDDSELQATVTNNTLAGLYNKSGTATVTGKFSGNGKSGIYNSGTCTSSNAVFSSNGEHGIQNTSTFTNNNSDISNNAKSGITNSGTFTNNNSNISNNQTYGVYNTGEFLTNKNTYNIVDNRNNSIQNNKIAGVYSSGTQEVRFERTSITKNGIGVVNKGSNFTFVGLSANTTNTQINNYTISNNDVRGITNDSNANFTFVGGFIRNNGGKDGTRNGIPAKTFTYSNDESVSLDKDSEYGHGVYNKGNFNFVTGVISNNNTVSTGYVYGSTVTFPLTTLGTGIYNASDATLKMGKSAQVSQDTDDVFLAGHSFIDLDEWIGSANIRANITGNNIRAGRVIAKTASDVDGSEGLYFNTANTADNAGRYLKSKDGYLIRSGDQGAAESTNARSTKDEKIQTNDIFLSEVYDITVKLGEHPDDNSVSYFYSSPYTPSGFIVLDSLLDTENNNPVVTVDGKKVGTKYWGEDYKFVLGDVTCSDYEKDYDLTSWVLRNDEGYSKTINVVDDGSNQIADQDRSITYTENNSLDIVANVYHPDNEDFVIHFIQPNSGYTYGTEVVSSYIVENKERHKYTDNSPLLAEFTPYVNYKVAGDNTVYHMAIYDSTSKVVVCPGKTSSGNGQNIFYFRWEVPTKNTLLGMIANSTDLNKSDITITGFNCKGFAKSQTDIEVFSDDTGTVEAVDIIKAQTPYATNRNLNAPSGFAYNAPTAQNKEYYNVVTWDEYVCNNGTFTKLTNTARITFTNNSLKPSESNPSQSIKNGFWFTRSGYSLYASINARANVSTKDQSDNAVTNTLIQSQSCTPVQTAECYFPEFNFVKAENKYDTLILNKVDSSSEFVFQNVKNGGTSESRHYIPLWYPDGDYILQTYVSDMWTPAGKLSYIGDSNTIKINGSLFSDYNTNEKSL